MHDNASSEGTRLGWGARRATMPYMRSKIRNKVIISNQIYLVFAGILIENIFNTKWNETQFETESQLQGETSSVTEIHFTPGTPFNFRTVLSYKF